LNFWQRFFERFVWVPVGLVAITGFETATEWTHAANWEYADATILSARTVCRYEKKALYERHGTFDDIYCDDWKAVSDKSSNGWKAVSRRLVEIRLEFSDNSGRKIQAQFKPWQDEAGQITKGQSAKIQYSINAPSNVDFAGAPTRKAREGLEAFILSLLLAAATALGWYKTKNTNLGT
jgi:hypothetical protein